MPAATSPIFPNVPIIGIASLVSNTAVSARTVIVGTTGLTQLTTTSTNGTRIDAITVKAQGTSVATQQFIWIYNGTSSYLYDEITIAAVTPSNTATSTANTVSYTTLVLPPTYQLYTSQTVSSNATVYAFGGQY